MDPCTVTPSACALLLTLSLSGTPSVDWRVSDVIKDSRCQAKTKCGHLEELIVEIIKDRTTMAPIRITVGEHGAPTPWSAESLDRNTIRVCQARPQSSKTKKS